MIKGERKPRSEIDEVFFLEVEHDRKMKRMKKKESDLNWFSKRKKDMKGYSKK